MKYVLFLFSIVCSSALFAQEPNDCINTISICGNINFTYTPTGPGNDDFLSNPNPGCLPVDPVEAQSVWLEIVINNPGNLEFVITPNNGTDDYDWAVYGPNTSCSNLGNPLRCSSTAFMGNGATGLGNGATDTTEGPGTGDAFLAPLTVSTGQRYYIFINNWSNSSSGFQLDFGSNVTFNDPPTIQIPFGVSIDLEECDPDNQAVFDLTVNSPIILGTQTGMIVQYYTSNGDAQIGNNTISNPTTYVNTTSPQTIYVRVTNLSTGCFETTQFLISITNSLDIGIPEDLYACNANGFAQFDLSQNDVFIQNGEPGSVVTYHASETDAISGNNDLPILHSNTVAFTQEVIWVRLENSITGCFSTVSFVINVFVSPTISQIPNQFVCDDDNDGFWAFDFPSLDSTALGAQSSPDFTVSYFLTQNDADNGTNAITSPYTNQTSFEEEEIFVRVDNNLNTNCNTTGSFLIDVFDLPSINLVSYELCDDNSDGDDTNGIVTFDLSTRVNEVLGAQLLSDYNVKFYETQTEADAAVLGTEITAPIQNINNPQTIVVRVENILNTVCYVTAPLNLVVNPLPVVNTVVELRQCDIDTDGFTNFNLTEANTLISNDSDNEIITYYLTELEAQAGLAADQIVSFVNYQNPIALSSVVFARVESTNGCFRTSRIDLVVGATQIPVSFNLDYFVCDDDLVDNDNTNGIASFDFSDATAQIEALFPSGQNLTISYYTNEQDALAETNAIIDITNFRNETSANVQAIFVRVDSDDVNACLGLGTHITLTVNPLPITNAITNYSACSDNDQAIFDLFSKDNEVAGSQVIPMLISYHLTEQDAIDNVSIVNASVYTNTSNPQTIYIRSQFDDNGNGLGDVEECFTTEMSFELIVNANPIIFDHELRVCSEQISTIYDLTTEEDQITNGDTSITLNYFESQLDVDTNNPIVDPSMYFNNLLDRDLLIVATGSNLCTSTAILTLKTILYSQINVTPTPIEECETDNDGFDLFDVTRREDEISNGLNPSNFIFRYYQSEADAIAGNSNNITNVLSFVNTQINEQTIFVRVTPLVNECFIVVPLTLIVNPVPEIAIEDQYVICLDNNNEIIDPVLETFLQTPPIDTQLSETEYTFQWYNGTVSQVNTDPDSVIITGATGSTSSPNTIGDYTVIATNIATQCTIAASTVVVGSYPPESILVELVSNAFASNNVLEVTVVGAGVYEFRLDFGPWQSSPIFENVIGGEHVVYVRDVLNCNEISEIQVVIDYPKFFTPNGDGYHDIWNIAGMANQPNARIYIFDRYGKLLKEISPSGVGWDGIYNGAVMATNDYWFVVEYREPRTNTKKEFRAHFTLKR